MVEIKINSHLSEFLKKINIGEKDALPKMGRVGVNNIKEETPVDTGFLQKHNKYSIESGELYFINDAGYGPYVEFGTYRMSSNAFMRRGIMKSTDEFTRIMIKEFRV